MKIQNFFQTREGKMSIASTLCLLALPVESIGFLLNWQLSYYISVGMVIMGMAFPPFYTYCLRR